MYRAHHLAASEQRREHLEERIDGKVGHLGVAVYHCRAVSQKQKDKPQRKGNCGETLKQIVEMHLWHQPPVIFYPRIFEFLYKHLGERRVCAYQFHHVIFKAFSLRLGYVHGHSLGSAHIEMRHYMKNSFLLILHICLWQNC